MTEQNKPPTTRGRKPASEIARYTTAALEDETELGPAMKALNPRQRGFVMAKFDLGDHPTDTECAYAAGFTSSTPNGMHVQAHRLAMNSKVQAAIREEADRRALSLLPMAHRRMSEKLLDKSDKDNFAVVKHVQALSGISPKQIHIVEHVNDRKALIEEIKASLLLLKSFGVSISEELVPVAIEAEFEEGTSNGLEDLL